MSYDSKINICCENNNKSCKKNINWKFPGHARNLPSSIFNYSIFKKILSIHIFKLKSFYVKITT